MTQPITPLRQRMLDDMRLRNMAAGTRKVYVLAVANFSAFHGRSPDRLTLEDVRDYQLHLVARGLKASIPSGRTAFPRAAIPRKQPDTAGEIGLGRLGGLCRGNRLPIRRGGPPCPSSPAPSSPCPR
jgi:hypothetical protein